MYAFLNIFFLVFHTGWMLFNCIGWAFKRTRPWHLLTIGLTAVSWFVLGWWYHQIGFCICTQWHWEVRAHLGLPPRYDSYTHFLFQELTGIDAPAKLADIVTASVFGVTTVLSIVLNLRDWWRASHVGAEIPHSERPSTPQ